MNNVKVNGNTYNSIERIRLTSADGGTVDFCDAKIYDSLLAGGSFDIYNTVTTKLVYCRFSVGAYTVNFPNVTTVGANCFMASSVTEIKLPKVATIGSTMCGNAGNLVKCDLGEDLSALPSQAFYGTSKLAALILRHKGIASLGTDAFKNSAIASGTGYVYVPSAQVEAYKADSAWSTYANQIRAIEDYPDETA